MKPNLSSTTLICVDCTDKLHLAERAIQKSMECADFADVKLLTHDATRKHAVTIPRIKSLQEYSRFMIRELHKYVQTMHALVVQWDGHPIQPHCWTNEFLNYDYGGAPFQPTNLVGNGGFGIRSKRLLYECSKLPEGNDHPEDAAVAIHFRKHLENRGIKFMPPELARRLSHEGRSWDSEEWRGIPNECGNSFGFHSFLSVLPKDVDKPNVYVHSGDAGDILYSLPVIKSTGGGVLFLTPKNNYPYPLNTRWTRTGGAANFMDNLRPLLEAQDYIWKVQYTHGHPASTTHDLNKFRLPWKNRSSKDWESILKLHCDAFGVKWPEDKPWLTVDDPIVIPNRPIVVNLTQRYRSNERRWDLFIREYADKIIFVGTPEEHELFNGLGAPDVSVPYYPTKDALELARVVAGAKVVVCNQSLVLAIAHGLCKNVIVDEWTANPNCTLRKNRGALYPKDRIEVPKEWL